MFTYIVTCNILILLLLIFESLCYYYNIYIHIYNKINITTTSSYDGSLTSCELREEMLISDDRLLLSPIVLPSIPVIHKTIEYHS